MPSERQQRVLSLVVESYLDDGRPVGSRAIAERHDVGWGPSTVRAELAALEKQGLLTHPHTSAGRVPTDAGYRFFADALLESSETLPAPRGPALELTEMRREVDEAMRETTSALSQITDLMALVSAPPPSTARIHRVEVLQLQPRVAMIVLIASNGAVAKRVFTFERPLDPGLIQWASSYLNERVGGLALGARMIADRIADPQLSDSERGFLTEIAGAFIDLEQRVDDLPRIDALMRALERRAGLLGMLRSALDERSVFLWIGGENPEPALRSVSVVGANYGLGYRNLGAVGVVGPLRMDYATAIASVREAAGELSRFFETVYEG
jgi:heat-inducible transcriptional repressor